MLKKGAMFGLDARIALAIFGALSVISGAALYSAIQQSKTVARLSSYEEMAKSIEAYFLDVGELPMDLNKSGSWIGVTSKLGELFQSSKTGWSGPYLQFEYDTANSIEFEGRDTNIKLHGVRSSSNAGSSMACSTSYSDCKVYLTIDYNGSEIPLAYEHFNALDALVDGSDGYRSGKIHAMQASNSTTSLDRTSGAITIMYKLMNCGHGLCY